MASDFFFFFFFSSRRRHTRSKRDWKFRRVLFRSVKQYAKSSITILLTALCALPVPAMPAGSASTRSRARRYVNRYPGVPTFADSTSTDDSTYDDPIVRAAAVAAIGRYNGAAVAVDPDPG